MRRAQALDINEIEKYYTITEDGMVWSKIKGRWMKPRMNIYGYVFYSIAKGIGDGGILGAFAHTLVALKYIGSPPTAKHEIDHVDENKQNNHWTNLRWVTHSENILKSYERGRRGHWLGRNKAPFSLEHKMKMADAKKKRVVFIRGEEKVVFSSIEEASVGLGTYRKKIYSSIKENKTFQGGTLSFLEDVFE